tara:strand:- start:103 stop:384 length:282 start_codon:yes stop_codon:yes gene_type:complete
MTLKKLLADLYKMSEEIAGGIIPAGSFPNAADFINRISHAIFACTDSEGDVLKEQRKMAGIATQMSKTCEQFEVNAWKNAAASLEQRGGFVRR